jgi:hypothetical protein
VAEDINRFDGIGTTDLAPLEDRRHVSNGVNGFILKKRKLGVIWGLVKA